jgi:hypothetical protein
MSLQSFYQTPSLQTIFVSVNRFSFPTLVLSSSILSMAMYLPETHPWHVFFHSLHYHLVNWGHLLIVSILFLKLIKSLTIWLLLDALFAPTFKFLNKLFRDHSLTYSSSFWPTLTNHALVGAFWRMPPIYVTRFWTLVETDFTFSSFPWSSW